MRRIGLLGGTFDPPHFGHLAIARAAIERFALDQVLLAPTGVQPLKLHRRMASFEDRCAMAGLLAAEDPRITLSRDDAAPADGTPNFTIDLLRTMAVTLGPEAHLYNIVGVDAFAGLPAWKDPRSLLDECDWIVVNRPDSELVETIGSVLSELARANAANRIFTLPGPAININSTDIRRRLREGLPCGDLLPESILDYIRQHKLYTATDDGEADDRDVGLR